MAGESALYKKFRAEQDAANAAYKSWEKDQWEKNSAEWTKQGYHREEDSNNAWGSKWSYTPNGNSGNSGNSAGINGGNSGGNGGSGLGSGAGVKVEDYSDLASSIQNTINNIPQRRMTDPYMGLWNKGNNPLATPGLKTQPQASADVEENSNNLPVAFKYKFKTMDAEGNRLGGTQYAADPSKYNVINVAGNPDIEDEHGNTWAKVNDSDKYALLSLGKNYSGPLKVGALRNGKYEQRNVSVSYHNGYTGTVNKNQFVTFDKQGGTMNKVQYFAGGGQPQAQNQQADAFMKAVLSGDQGAIGQLIQLANKGDKNATQLIQTILQEEQKGNTQVAKAASVIKQLVNSAKWGSKLQYMRSLKYAKGGKSCPVCEQQKVEMKKCGGKKAKKRYFGGYL